MLRHSSHDFKDTITFCGSYEYVKIWGNTCAFGLGTAPYRNRQGLQSHYLKGSDRRAFTTLKAYLRRRSEDRPTVWKFLSLSTAECIAYEPLIGYFLHEDLYDSDQEEWEIKRAWAGDAGRNERQAISDTVEGYERRQRQEKRRSERWQGGLEIIVSLLINTIIICTAETFLASRRLYSLYGERRGASVCYLISIKSLSGGARSVGFSRKLRSGKRDPEISRRFRYLVVTHIIFHCRNGVDTPKLNRSQIALLVLPLY